MKYRRRIGELKAISADLYIDRYIDRLSTDCRPTVDRQSIDYRPIYRSTIGRQPTDLSTDISVDVSVESAAVNMILVFSSCHERWTKKKF